MPDNARSLALCQCCAMKLTNDDETSCRDFYGHDHAGLSVPAGTVVSEIEPRVNDRTGSLTCDGHGGEIEPMGHYWNAEIITDGT